MGMLWAFLKHDHHDKIDQLTQKKIIIKPASSAVICLRRRMNCASLFFARYMRGESDRLAMLITAPAMQGPPKEQPPGNSQVKEPFHVSDLESGTAVPTDGDNRQLAPPGNRQAST